MTKGMAMCRRVEAWTPEALRDGFDAVARSLGITPAELEVELGRVVYALKGSAMGCSEVPATTYDDETHTE